MIKTKSYTIQNSLITSELLSAYVDLFWKEVFDQLTNNPSTHSLMLMCKISFAQQDIITGMRCMGHLRTVNYEDKELYQEYLSRRLSILNDSYTTQPVSKLIFSYLERKGVAVGNRALLQDISDKSLPKHSFNNMILPITMIPSEYGDVRLENYVQVNGESIHRFMVKNGPKNYEIDVSSDGLVNRVSVQGASDLHWTDTLLSEGVIKREIGKSTKYFIDGINVLNKQILPAKPFKKVNPDSQIGGAFITMDIETVNIESKLTPYLICAYNGKNYITSYASSSLNQQELFTNFINQLISKSFSKSKNLMVYAHNLSGFDGVFLMKQLLTFGKVTPLLFNGKLMSINLITPSGKTIIFKDSYLLLPHSLRLLCKAFGIGMGKGYFPFKLSNIFYTGVLPKFEYWTGISLTTFESLALENKNKFWSFQQEAIKYCKLDCQCLHELLVKFNQLIFKEFNINIHKVLTLPSLAMRIFKTHFMPKDTIYQLLGEVEQNIRQAYTGGAVDVYIPHNRTTPLFSNFRAIFTKLFYYDVNSLYPTVMARLPMPIGKPVAFEGDIRRLESDAFGIFYCKITSPDNLLHPILQRKIKGRGTVAGLGTWHGWIPSIEMDNAVKYGYTFEILKGYQFDKGDLFSGYVNKMFSLRNLYDKTHPMNLIAKLLLNSLYGKFGMKVENTRVDIFNLNLDADKLALKALLDTVGHSIQYFLEFDKNHYIFKVCKRALPDSNWDNLNWQSSALPIKLRAQY